MSTHVPTRSPRTIFAERALLPHGWSNSVRIGVEAGRISAVVPDARAEPDDERHAVVVPGMPNVHSHAFQRAMAGFAERRGPTTDTFWSWREAMYRCALAMSAQDVETVAAQLYVEMLEAGFCRVGEFHYLHHDRDGRPYANIAEMAERIAAAASETGIGLTLLPVFYAHSDFGGSEPSEGQRRFVTTPDAFARLMEKAATVVSRIEGSVIGVAPHSLRAVTPAELAEVTALSRGGPIHIHVAEQIREVEACLAWSGARPVEWLLDHAAVDGRWCLIHATHTTADEVRTMAARGAVVGVCPITEANLGDGIFAAADFLAEGGRLAVGTDSNVMIGVADELRQLEYAQRLALRARNVLARPNGSTGRALFETALGGGAAALGHGKAAIAAGSVADLVSLRVDGALASAADSDGLLDTWIFTGAKMVDCVWVRGQKVVSDGRHRLREPIAMRFAEAMQRIWAR